MDAAILRVNEVLAIVGVRHRATLWRWTKQGSFPSPVRLGARGVAWRRSDIDAWLSSLRAVVSND